MENTFLEKKLTDNANQDPMGNDAHQGLERFLDKFHQPGVPSHTIITDPEYFVFLWFHDANGKLIDCPYISDYTPKLSSTSVKFSDANKSFGDGQGIQSGTDDVKLPEHCFDLTPFVREATLPDIQPAGGEKITTLFGETTAGSFSPYASDGQKSITLQVLDTEYSILDAIFYPWMKDINSPWWYKSEAAYTEWTTPYPMATLEILRPRMRYSDNAKAAASRSSGSYKYYSYKFLGVKPTNYTAFNVNAAGPTTLLRNLTMVADMCFVDMTQDAIGIASGSTSPGARNSISSGGSGSGGGVGGDAGGSSEKSDSTAPESRSDMQQAAQNAQKELDDADGAQQQNQQDAQQQKQGDLPGKDEPEMYSPTDPNYRPDEYADTMSEAQSDREQAHGGQNPNTPPGGSAEYGADGDPAWSADKANYGSQVEGKVDTINRTVNDGQIDKGNAGNGARPQKVENSEKSLLGTVMDGLSKMGNGIGDAAKSTVGWVGNTIDGIFGVDRGNNGAVGVATGVPKDAVQNATSSSSGDQKKSQQGASGNMFATALGAVGNLVGSAANAAGQVVGGAGTVASTALGGVSSILKGETIGNTSAPSQQTQQKQAQKQPSRSNPLSSLSSQASNAYEKGDRTAFGVVQGVASDAGRGISQTTSILGGLMKNVATTTFNLAGDIVGQAGKVVGGVTGAIQKAASPAQQQQRRAALEEDEEENSLKIRTGMVYQNADAIEEIRLAGELAASMNEASEKIVQDMDYVGDLAGYASSLQSQSSTSQTHAGVSELAWILRRVTFSEGNAPTPIEAYVDIVAQN